MTLDPAQTNPLSSFRRRLVAGEAEREVSLDAGMVGWLPAQQHHGVNIGETPSHAIFIELKEPAGSPPSDNQALGPRE